MTSPTPAQPSSAADDGAPSDDDDPLASGEAPAAEADETPSSAPLRMLGIGGGDACGADGCCQG